MDPLADKLLVSSALICMIELGFLPAWIVIIIISREFIITGFRLIAAEGGLVIAASWWGKIKTVTQMLMIILVLFGVGGIICTLVQIFLDHTKLMPGRVMVLLVITGVILGAAGIYGPLIKWAGCGASVPLSGFGYNLSKGVIEAVKEEGTIGLFKGGLKAAAAGPSYALIFSYLAALLFQTTMKE